MPGGFTFVGVALAFSLMVALATITVPLIIRLTANARIAKAQADVVTLAEAIGVYSVHCAGLPPVGGSANAICLTQGAGASGQIPLGLTVIQRTVAGATAGPFVARVPDVPSGWKGSGSGYTYVVDKAGSFNICASGDGFLVTLTGGPICVTGGASTTPALSWHSLAGAWSSVDGGLTSNDLWSKAVADVPGPDYTFGLSMRTTPKGPDVWNVSRVLVRFQDEKNFYAVVPKIDGSIELAKMQHGVWLPWLASANAKLDPSQSHQYDVSVSGSRIQVSVDGRLLINFTDANPIRSGGVGVGNDRSAATFSGAMVTMSGS